MWLKYIKQEERKSQQEKMGKVSKNRTGQVSVSDDRGHLGGKKLEI